MRTNAHRYAHRGMTLVELLIVVAIVAILGTIAMGSYRNHVLRSNRAEATAALLRIQAAQEKYYLNQHQYTDDPALLGSAESTERGLYTIDIALDDDGQGFTAQATAAGQQARDADCPIFTIDQAGRRDPDPAASRCWQ